MLPVGSSFDGAVSLSCTSGLPTGAQRIFSPSTPVTPGSSGIDVVMSISTKAAKAESKPPITGHIAAYAIWSLLPGIVFVGGLPLRRRGQRTVFLLIVVLIVATAMLSLASCAGVNSSGGGGGGNPPPNPKSYQVMVTGTSSGTPADAGQSTTVILVVN